MGIVSSDDKGISSAVSVNRGIFSGLDESGGGGDIESENGVSLDDAECLSEHRGKKYSRHCVDNLWNVLSRHGERENNWKDGTSHKGHFSFLEISKKESIVVGQEPKEDIAGKEKTEKKQGTPKKPHNQEKVEPGPKPPKVVPQRMSEKVEPGPKPPE